MVIGLDSATPPTSAEVQAARAGGIAVWSGYLATRPLMRLARPWTQAEFAIVRTLPGQPIAYASGWDDPAACKALAAAWSVRLCLDVEAAIRPDGPWVQAWLDASGAGLYGTQYVHTNRRAAFHVAAWYVNSDPRASWPNWPKPTAPCGWQWRNTHDEFGVGVDRCWLDDFFGGEQFMLSDTALFGLGHLIVSALYRRPATAAEVQALGLKADLSNLDAVVQAVENNVIKPTADVYKLQNTTLRHDLDALPSGAAGPAGPKGDPGPPGPGLTPGAPIKATITPE